MEISDRNNIMQLALNLNFDSKTVSQNSSSAFIDMIKVPEFKSTSENIETPVASKQETSKQVVREDKKEIKNDNNTKQSSQDKKVKENTVKSKDKSTTKKVKNSSSDDSYTNNTTEVQNNTVSNENSEASVATANVAPVNTQQTEETSSDYNYETAFTADIKNPTLSILPLNIDLAADTEVLPEQSVELPTGTVMTTDSSQEQIVVADNKTPQEVDFASEEIASPVKLSQETEVSDFQDHKTTEHTLKTEAVNSQDELLIKQAQILDQKVTSEKPLKIEVNVDAAKIAEPHHQEILQNSFEITSMLQNTEKTIDDFSVNNVPQIDNTDIVIDDAKQTVNVAKNEAAQPQVNNMYALSASETIASAHIESEVLASQPQEIQVVNLQQHIIQSENSPKLQDLNTDVSLKGLGKEVVEQIKVNITKSAVKGVDTIDIELKPEELGKVQVRMYISKDGKLHTDIIASRQETADLLQREVDGLSKAFQDAGYDTDKQSFNFSFQKENQAGDQAREQKLQQFIGETLEQEAEDNLANDNMIYDPRRGLNIRV